MKLIAYVKEKRTGERLYIERDNYQTKKDFISDLRGNGYAVSCCHTPAQHEKWLRMIDRAGAWGLKNITQAKIWQKNGWLND